VPVPEEGETVTQAVLNALFLRRREAAEKKGQQQLMFAFDLPEVTNLHRRWDLDAAREKENRTRFAQRALKPAEVRRELEATDAVLGDPAAVRDFVLNACQRLGISIRAEANGESRMGNGKGRVPLATRHSALAVYRVAVGPEARTTLPAAIEFVLPKTRSGFWEITFDSPTPEGAEYLGRNHRFVSTLAQFLLEEALTKGAAARASRCGVIRTRAVSRLTMLYLLRIRFLLQQPDRVPMLAEEVHVIGHTGAPRSPTWLKDDDALALLAQAQPDANVPPREKSELAAVALNGWPEIESALHDRIGARASALLEAHRRVRQAVSMKVRGLTVQPQMPPDLLGVLVLTPLVR
jgi:hypothetical protein